MSVDERKELLTFSHVKMYYPVKDTKGLFERSAVSTRWTM